LAEEQQRYEAHRRHAGRTLDAESQARIRALAEDFPRVWNDPLILLANSPDRPEAEPMREILLISWRQPGQKQDPGPASPNHNAIYNYLLSRYGEFANSITPWSARVSARGCSGCWSRM
jgi:hypothetical protein